MNIKDMLITIILKMSVILVTTGLIAITFKASESSTGALIPLLVIFGASFLIYYAVKDSE